MKQQSPIQNDFEIFGLFPTPVYITRRDSNLDLTEEKEIEDIIEGGMEYIDESTPNNKNRYQSLNTYIFDTKLKKIKQFCEQQIEKYVEEILTPKNKELNFYITQSWLNIIKPGGYHHHHYHPNSIISGVFYVSTVEDDKIRFFDFRRSNQIIKFEPKEGTFYNSESISIDIKDSVLLLFPSLLIHCVEPNEKATTDRISLSFNVFVKGNIGNKHEVNELFLQ
jgi:uncharacterized protein (TIGR02466 family)